MSTKFQVTFDCQDPHVLADFWAAALGYDVESFENLIGRLQKDGHLPASEVVDHAGRPCFRIACACLDPDGVRSRLLFQIVPEGKSVKNRVHLDLNVGHANIPQTVERLITLGATKLWAAGEPGQEHCLTLADPEGNEFCVQ